MEQGLEGKKVYSCEHRTRMHMFDRHGESGDALTYGGECFERRLNKHVMQPTFAFVQLHGDRLLISLLGLSTEQQQEYAIAFLSILSMEVDSCWWNTSSCATVGNRLC